MGKESLLLAAGCASIPLTGSDPLFGLAETADRALMSLGPPPVYCSPKEQGVDNFSY